jgi:hypothetical protein
MRRIVPILLAIAAASPTVVGCGDRPERAPVPLPSPPSDPAPGPEADAGPLPTAPEAPRIKMH